MSLLIAPDPIEIIRSVRPLLVTIADALDDEDLSLTDDERAQLDDLIKLASLFCEYGN